MYGECHAHIFMNGYSYKEAVELHTDHVDEDRIRANLLEYQKRGITFIRDGGDPLGVSLRAREIAVEYGIRYRTPAFAIHKKGHYGSIVGMAFENMQEYAELVNQVKKKKGDFIKIMVSGIMDFNHSKVVTGTPLSFQEIKEMVHIAHAEGFSVMAHANSVQAVKNAILAGVDSIEHGNYLDEVCVQVMAEKRTVFVPTIVTIKNLMGCGRYPKEELEKIYAAAVQSLKRAYESDVLLAMGSDAGAFMVAHGQGILDEYGIFQEVLGADDALEKRLEMGEKRIRDIF